MIRTIHHFEDEPELVQWIPGALLNRYWMDHPDWISDDASFTENDEEHLTSFRLSPGAGEVCVHYRVYRTADAFRDRFPRFVQPGDVVLLDIMGESPDDGSLVAYGLSVLELAEAHVGKERVYFLTAFPHKLLEGDSLDSSRVMSKPPDADALIVLLVNELAVVE